MARQMFRRKRFCRFTVEGIKEIDYKDVDLLKDFISENGKIIPARITAHGMQRLIEGAEVAYRRVLVVEDTSTTGGSVLTAVRAVRGAGGEVVGVATVVDRATGAAEAIAAAGLAYRSVLGLADLGL